jgi:DnaJ domain
VAHDVPSASEARAVLGLSAVATPAQVTTAFRRHARQVHPDVSAARDAAGRFAALVAAYDVALQAAQRASERRAQPHRHQRIAASADAPAHGLHDVVTGPGGTAIWQSGQPVFLVGPVRVHPPSAGSTDG